MVRIGKLSFHSETGTEGGYYALQDSEHIAYITPEFGVFAHRTVYDPEDMFRTGIVRGSCRDDGSEFKSAKRGDIAYLDIDWDDQTNDVARPSDTVHIEGWSYEGLVILKNDDRLTVFQRGIGGIALWEGVVHLEAQDPYASDSYAPFGMASHSRPKETDPETEDTWSSWFFQEHWAKLERSE